MEKSLNMRRLPSSVCLLLCLSLLVCILLCSATPSVFAESGGAGSQSLEYYVSDAAGILTQDQWQRLESAAESVSQQYGCGVYIITVDDYTRYISGSVQRCAEAFYSNYGLGFGENRNGSLLFLSMADRDYWLLAYGAEAHSAFTDYASNWLSDQFLDDFRSNDWSGGFADYIQGCEHLLALSAAGTPMDVPQQTEHEGDTGMGPIVTIFAPLLTALGVTQGMKRTMKPVRRKTSAEDYIVPGGIDLRLKRDVFVNRTVSRTVIHTENRSPGSHGGGFSGGTTVNSGGFSGHGGKF